MKYFRPGNRNCCQCFVFTFPYISSSFKVRHEKKDLLEKIAGDMILTVLIKLSSAVSLDTYPTWTDAITGGKKFPATVVSKHAAAPVFIPPYLPDKLVSNYPGTTFHQVRTILLNSTEKESRLLTNDDVPSNTGLPRPSQMDTTSLGPFATHAMSG